MHRRIAHFRIAFVIALGTALPVLGQMPTDSVERRLTAQTTLATAKQLLAQDRAGEAALALEAALSCAEGDPAFLALLKEAYRRELAQGASETRTAALTQRMKLLTGTGLSPAVATPPAVEAQPEPPAVATPPAVEAQPEAQASLQQATQLFQAGGADPAKLATAAQFFASAFQKVEMTPEQLAAWAFCRVRVAHDQLNQGANPAEVRAEIESAVKLAPNSAPVRERADAVLALLPAAATPATDVSAVRPSTTESANFRATGVAYPAAAKLIESAEAHRKAIHTYWTGQVPRAWGAKCELVLHATAAALADATKSAGSGSATVTFTGQSVTRKLHLAIDDAMLLDDSLPRELTHLVLADLFPSKAPPEWAAVGMAAIATSAGEQGRYLRTLDRLARSGETLPASGIVGGQRPPQERMTAFHVESLAIVQYLANLKGGPAFIEFLAESERYGVATALKKRYGVTDVAMLEAWASR